MIIRPTVNIRPFVLVEHAGLRYLAVIQNGAQIGALAQTLDGRYVLVNGAVVQPLNTFKVLRALRREFPRKNWSRNPPLHQWQASCLKHLVKSSVPSSRPW
jgi:hypothetical protein